MTGNTYKLVLSILLSTFLSFQSARADNVRIVSMVLGEGLQQEGGAGFYGEIMSAILQRADSPAAFIVYPFKRALRVFAVREADCIWALDIPFLRQLQVDAPDLKESAFVFHSTQRLFTAAGDPPIRDLSELRGKTVGVLNGANTERLLEKYAATVVKLPDQETKLRMLAAGRLDVIGGWAPDLHITMRVLGLSPGLFRASYELSASDVRLVCHDTPRTAAFIEEIDRAIGAVLRSGDYANILEKYGASASLN